jgi:hypothetical protein
MSMNYIQYLSVSKFQYKHKGELQAVPTKNYRQYRHRTTGSTDTTTGSTDTQLNARHRSNAPSKTCNEKIAQHSTEKS